MDKLQLLYHREWQTSIIQKSVVSYFTRQNIMKTATKIAFGRIDEMHNL